ncbi:MAG TPA: allantoinase AllB [Pyrinomonadaceae bacterium]|nr:allantoinase AllB [Pyrinomonadaceae bacterium]
MHAVELVIRGRRVVTEHGVGPASVHITRGYISSISIYEDVPATALEVIEAFDSVVMPGLIDTHVHVNEPGRTEWEGFETATRAAAAGGVTTIVDMPLNSIPATTTFDALQEKLEAAREKLHVDVGFWGGVVPGNTSELAKLWEAGVAGFKCFLIHSGVDEFPNVTEADLREAMPELARLGALLIVHAELPGPVEACCQALSDSPTQSYKTFLASRPRQAENEAVDLMTRLCRETGCRVHIVHHSSADALTMLREAKRSGLAITAETCPHYLHFAAEEIRDGATEFKCCPPIRERENRERLWDALRDGTIDFVVSDHSPCPPDMKLREQGDFMNAWGGISSLQLRLPLIWTEASRRGFTIEDLTKWLCHEPAKQVGLEVLKGAIKEGADADLIIWDPDREFKVEPSMLHHRHKLTPYNGEVLRGVVEKTFVRGRMVYDGAKFSTACGRVILRPRN